MFKTVFAFLLVIALAFGAVTELTDANFAEETATGTWFVKFYAPWCGHCKKLAPTWADYSDSSDNVKVAHVDCTVNSQVCKDQGVSGYPTLKLFHNGDVFPYKGKREISAFKEFAAEKTA
eukprot:TRINITY_DN1275_c0_g1_i2.p1 TRINITY_DN1275_c0_g1~~TRINITY_DN1275_c0_g1_i2.p1  ORF type:complete len:132 (-),score=10.96 TRINITY_DN1275_c0_g1_i2:62-421(-)